MTTPSTSSSLNNNVNNIDDLIIRHVSADAAAVQCIHPLFANTFPEGCATTFVQRITRLLAGSFATDERRRAFVEACYRMPTMSVVGSVRALSSPGQDFRSDIAPGLGPFTHCLLHAEKVCRGGIIIDVPGRAYPGAIERIPVTEASLGRVSAKLIAGLACAMYAHAEAVDCCSIDDVQQRFVGDRDRVHTATMIQEVWRFVRRAVVYRAGLALYPVYALRPDEAEIDLDDCVQYADEMLAFLRGMYSSVESVPSGFLDQMLFTGIVRSADTLGKELFPDSERSVKDIRVMFSRAFEVPVFREGVSDAMDLARSFCVHQLLRTDEGSQDDLAACTRCMKGMWDEHLEEPTDLLHVVRTGLRGSFFRSDARYCPFLS